MSCATYALFPAIDFEYDEKDVAIFWFKVAFLCVSKTPRNVMLANLSDNERVLCDVKDKYYAPYIINVGNCTDCLCMMSLGHHPAYIYHRGHIDSICICMLTSLFTCIISVSAGLLRNSFSFTDALPRVSLSTFVLFC